MVRSKGESGPPMVPPVEFKFRIDAYSPTTIPMARLARYLQHLAVILGEPQSVHFLRLEGGSTVPVIAVEWEAVPKVKKRANEVRNNEGPKDARDAKAALERDLADDNATGGELIDNHGGRVLYFHRRPVKAVEYGPFNQAGTLDGIVIRIGGESVDADPVPVLLQGALGVHVCRAPLLVARRLWEHWLGDPIRVSGTGRWMRTADGAWEQRQPFTISDFQHLQPDTLSAVVKRLRSIPAAWKNAEDPIADMMAVRNDPSEAES